MKKAAEFAFVKSIPIMLGYVFLGIAFGLVLQKAGLGPLWALIISAGVYAGSMQFALVGILTGGLSFITTAVMTLFINSRHAFYGLTFIERFKKMRKAYPYMVFSLTDETYSLLCSMARPRDFTDREWDLATLLVSLFDQCYWVAGSVLGALAGQLITFDSTGIDFAMTALFVVICADQWKHAKTHIPAIAGFGCGIFFLALIRSANFILPALAAVVLVLLFSRRIIERKMEE
ncbi:MAG: AzlC family ABC transporter permease [Enterocloster asparagiformis]|nr:AzlC family ABC transporter permease [Enterocloster asparagiformis]